MTKIKLTLLMITLVFTSNIAMAQSFYNQSSNGLNMRSGPGTSNAIVLAIPGGAKVKVIDQTEDWWKVEYAGKKGFVMGKFISHTKPNNSRSNASKKTKVASSASSLSASNFNRDWGLGLRFGDPSGISIKKYMNGKALELSIGRTLIQNKNGWYDDQFQDWHGNKNELVKDLQYMGYDASSPLGIQFHYLIQKKINTVLGENASGLDWYYGFGAQARFQTYSYDYRYKLDGNSDWLYVNGEKITNFDLGIDGVVGLEYTFKDLPISMFTDANLFMEIADDPFNFWFQGAIGARYNF